MKKPRKPKKLPYELIPRDSEIGQPMYRLLAGLVTRHHGDLRTARIALAWALSWKGDVDGHVTIGRCKRATDLDRELAAFDFVILLSRPFWTVATDKAREALVDHELCHAAVKYDDAGEPVVDERGQTVYRTRKHDIEEFAAIVERHGVWKHELEAFIKALERARTQSRYSVAYQTIASKLAYAGFHVPVERIIYWTEDQRRTALEWVHLRAELQKASSGAALVPAAPPHVLEAATAPSLLTTETH